MRPGGSNTKHQDEEEERKNKMGKLSSPLQSPSLSYPRVEVRTTDENLTPRAFKVV
jgi:hypothetical protein